MLGLHCLLANLPSERDFTRAKGGKKMKTQNVLIAGVGGEGVLTAGVIIARAAGLKGLQVKGIQLHGLAQRGGSVPTHVGFGKQVGAPTIPMMEADLILAQLTLVAAPFPCKAILRPILYLGR